MKKRLIMFAMRHGQKLIKRDEERVSRARKTQEGWVIRAAVRDLEMTRKEWKNFEEKYYKYL